MHYSCGKARVIALGLCATCYTLKRQDEEHFGGLREAVLRRDGYRCRVCATSGRDKWSHYCASSGARKIGDEPHAVALSRPPCKGPSNERCALPHAVTSAEVVARTAFEGARTGTARLHFEGAASAARPSFQGRERTPPLVFSSGSGNAGIWPGKVGWG